MPYRILMFGWEFPPHNSGGLGVACQGIARALVERGAKLNFVLPRSVDLSDSEIDFLFADIPQDSIEVDTVETLISSPYITSSEYNERLAQKSGEASLYGKTLIEEVRRYGRAARKIAKRARPDIIHAHDWLSFPAGLNAKNSSGAPLVSHVHATEYDRTGGNGVNQQVHEIERSGTNQADHVLSVSGFTKNILTKHYGVPAEKISVAHNGIDPEHKPNLPSVLKKHKQRGGRIVLFLGRQTIQKGPDYFLRAAKLLSEIRDDVLYVMAGSGDMTPQLMRLSAELGIADKVLFPGFVRGEKTDQLYQSSDLYVMPSISEPFGITPLEALMNNTPVLISKQSGVSEVLNHALKIDFWDTQAMADRMNAVLEHSSLHSSLRDNGRRQVGTIGWDKTAEACFNCYNRLLVA